MTGMGDGVRGGVPVAGAGEAVSPGASLPGAGSSAAARPQGPEGVRQDNDHDDAGRPQPDRTEPAEAAPQRATAASLPGSSSPVQTTPPPPAAPADRTPPSPPSPSSAAPPAADTPLPANPALPDAVPPVPEEPAPVFVRRAQLPGGGAIQLGGIAFSTNPVALLNGKVVGVGEVVDGMTVVAIVPGRVELEGRGTRLALAIE